MIGRTRNGSLPAIACAGLLAIVALTCAPARSPRASKDGEPPERRAETAPRPARPVPAAPEPLVEDERGIVGAPMDDTGFDFEPEVEVPGEPLRMDGIPAPASAVLRAIGPYLDIRRARLASASADGKHMLVLTRLGETTQAHLLSGPMTARQQITFGPDPVQQATFVPKNANRVTYRVDRAGDENFQVVALDLITRRALRLSDGTSRHGPFRWSGQGNSIAFMRTVSDPASQELMLGNGVSPAEPFLSLEGQWVTLGYSRDATRLLLQQFWSETRSALALLNTKTKELTPIGTPQDGVSHEVASFTNDPDLVLATTNRNSDFVQLHSYHLVTKEWKNLSADIPWDVEELAVAPNGRMVVFSTNEDGQSTLYSVGIGGGRAIRLKLGITGVVSELRFFGPARLAFTLTRANEPGDVFTYELDKGRLVRWTQSESGGLNPSRFVTPTLVRVRSFDKLEVPCFVYRPEGKGPFPVLLWMHGGPEEQFRPSFDPIVQYFVARGIVVLAPNIRGSDGYGRRYLSLDDGVRRGDAVRDVGAILDWIAARPDLDSRHVGIHGVSYGGFMVLAALAEYGDRIVAGSNQVGIANIVTFLENTRGYRRTLRRAEYGDETDPDVRARLLEVSPLTRADRIRSALLVAHGMRDPRVPVSEAESIVRAVRERGNEVWYLLAPSEGHSFRQRQNRDTFYRTMATFFERHLLEPRATATEDSSPSANVGPLGPDSGAPVP